jgi:hypothetical protein
MSSQQQDAFVNESQLESQPDVLISSQQPDAFTSELEIESQLDVLMLNLRPEASASKRKPAIRKNRKRRAIKRLGRPLSSPKIRVTRQEECRLLKSRLERAERKLRAMYVTLF